MNKINEHIDFNYSLDIIRYGRKNKIKGIIIGSVISGLIFSGIGVVAIGLNANEIKYTPSNEKFTVTNAKEALDEVYKIAQYKIPNDTYFYDSNTEGDNIVRYKKVDGKYYLCDENGKVIDKTEQDVSNLSLIEYSSINQTYLSSGKAGFASGNFYLGNGSDNLDSYNNGYNFGVSAADKRVNTSSASYTSGYNNGLLNGLRTRRYTIDYSSNGTPTICEYDVVNYKSANITITGKYNNGYRPIYIYGDGVLLYSGAPSYVNLNFDVTNYSTLKVSDTAQSPYWAGATIVITIAQ